MKYCKMKQFKIRCSQIGQIMTNGTKGEPMGKTVKSYLDEWIKEQLYSRRKEFESKYTNKGNQVEAESIDFIADQLGYGMLLKNETLYENDFLIGTPDIVLNDTIIDAKNSWDCFTFPLFETEINKDYFYQGQGYMALTERENYKLIYCLTDTPEDLIIKEAQSYCYRNGLELDDEVLNKFIKKMTYKDIPDHLKIKPYEFKIDHDIINMIYERVDLCRKYIAQKLDNHKDLF
jgi:hypothetical protein